MSPTITRAQPQREIGALADAISEATHSPEAGPRVEALRAALAHPCAYHELEVPRLWIELALALADDEDWDGAIEAQEQAIRRGARACRTPTPTSRGGTCERVAGIALARSTSACGRMRRKTSGCTTTPASSYADAGAHQQAAAWLTAGLEIALEIGDPDDVVDQLLDLRRESLEALGQDSADALDRRARAFLRARRRPPAPWPPP